MTDLKTAAARTARATGAILGVIIMAGLLALPLGLWHFIGWPLPDHIPDVAEITSRLQAGFSDTQLIINGLAILVWVFWARLAYLMIACAVDYLRHGPEALRHIDWRTDPLRATAAVLIGAIMGGLLFDVARSVAAATPASAAPAPTTVTAAATAHTAVVMADEPGTYRVRSGDTLTGIAAQQLGDAQQWRAIWTLNRGTTFADGRTFTEPNILQPGWILQLPTGPVATPAGGATYQVEKGDDLAGIAQRFLGHTDLYPQLAASNSATITDPDHIEPGWQLTLPGNARDRGVQPHATGCLLTPTPDTPAPPAVTAAADTPPPQPEQVTPTPSTPTPEPPRVPAHTPSALPTQPAPHDDGVAEPAGSPATATPSADETRDASHGEAVSEPGGFLLPSGSFVTAGLAVLIAGAAAVVWRLRRRDYRRRDPQPQLRLEGAETAPLPATVSHLRHAVSHLDATLAAASPVPPTAARTGWTDTEWPASGLGLTGPGAEAAARALLVHALAGLPHQGPESRTHVVIPAATLATLFGAAAVHLPTHPRLIVTGDLGDALDWAERQQLARTRAVYEYEVEDVDALRDADPLADPIPPIMLLLADATAGHHRARVSALLLQGSRLDIHGTLLGGWPDGPSLHIDTHGTATSDDPDAPQRMSVLSAAEAAAILGMLAEAATGQLATAAQPAPVREAAPDETKPAIPADTGDADADDMDPAAAESEREPERDGNQASPPVAVRILGGAVIAGSDDAQPSLRGKARELLVYLAARGGKAAQYAIFEDLLPEAPRSKAPGRLHTYVYNLRQHLNAVGGDAEYVAHPQGSYILNPRRLDVDLWQMHAAIAQAAKAATRAEKITAWWQAIQHYRGPLADGYDYEWIESYRNGLHRQILDVYLALADAHATAGQHDQALAVLRVALEHDPIAEATYRQAMGVNAAIGDADAIKVLRRDLLRHLEQLDLPATEETLDHAEQLLAQLRKRPGKAPGH